jgi:type 1 glutamine amidotransferase
MTRSVRLFLFAALLIAPAAVRADDETGFVQLFDGKTLEGWDGNPEFWSVRDGAITGQTTPEKPTKGNTFIIWRKGEVADFELRAEFKINGGNSGIQYRSAELPDNKWVIRGYQADFDGAGGWTGSLYEEKGRGVLAKRGNKAKIPAGGKPEMLGATTPEADILASVKKDDWNEYVIIAQGNHLIQKLNGHVTVDLIDEDMEKGKASGLLALQLHAGPPMTVQFRNIRIKQLPKVSKSESMRAPVGPGKKIVFVAGRPSHAFGAHEHNAGCKLLAMELEKALPHYQTKVYTNGWPTEAEPFAGADAIVMYSDGGAGHMVNPHLDEVDALAKKGVGIVCIHYAVEVPAEPAGKKFLEWIGGYFEANWSVNPHWTASFKTFPNHPIANGVKPFSINDEWYYHMRFRPNMEGVTPILTDLPGPETLSRPDGAHSGNPHVRKAVAAKEVQHVAWASENVGGGRGFGFTGGHDHWNWGCPDFRKIVLNAIVWTAKGEVPPGGVESPTVSLAMLEQNMDPKKNDKFDRAATIKKIKDAGGMPE